MIRYATAIILVALSPLATAAEGMRPAYVQPPPAVSSGNIVQIIVSLLLVLAAIVLVAWVLRRMNMGKQGSGSHLKVLSGIAIGQRERIVLVEIKDAWLVVGVGPGQIRTLHTMQKPEDGGSDGNPGDTQSAGSRKNFAAALSSALGSIGRKLETSPGRRPGSFSPGKRDAP